ncbi:MAG TPA: MarR family winged helix-turn-helix transcriptional regulator, partial [Gemmatimonadaceae bacterium]|nr:MarR family winged helix-turn-helix transcriptional regulator [Gemmatimonadaceae bacterium]
MNEPTATNSRAPTNPVAAVRQFNRFYTKQIGVLREGHLDSPFSLTEVRVLYELAHREDLTATDLVKELGLDGGYVSRILRGFERRELVQRSRSNSDARRSLLRLTEAGQAAFDALDARADAEVGSFMSRLQVEDRERVVEAMHTIERTLAPGP